MVDFLLKLLPGHLALTDRDVTYSVNTYHAELKIPVFIRGEKKTVSSDRFEKYERTSVRRHIERVTGALRQKYTVLQNTLPVTLIDTECKNDDTYLGKTVKVCCALTDVSVSVSVTQCYGRNRLCVFIL